MLDNFDLTTLLNPSMPNTGGMEVMESIKRELSTELEAVLSTSNNLSGDADESIFN